MTMAAARLSLFAAGLLGLTLIACTSEFTDYCDKKVACRAENDKDRNACVADREGDKAEEAGHGGKVTERARGFRVRHGSG